MGVYYVMCAAEALRLKVFARKNPGILFPFRCMETATTAAAAAQRLCKQIPQR